MARQVGDEPGAATAHDHRDAITDRGIGGAWMAIAARARRPGNEHEGRLDAASPQGGGGQPCHFLLGRGGT